MIFVTVGTNEAPFDRLIAALDAFPPGEDLVVQAGASRLRPARAMCIDFLPFDRLVEYVREARLVVAHAGVGSIMVALANGKRPVVVPRLHRHGEAVDDHQLELARRLDEHGLVTLVEDPARLPVAAARSLARTSELNGDGRLAHELREYLEGTLANPSSRVVA